MILSYNQFYIINTDRITNSREDFLNRKESKIYSENEPKQASKISQPIENKNTQLRKIDEKREFTESNITVQRNSDSPISPKVSETPCFLAAVLCVRILQKDKARLTKSHLFEWIKYMRYAGVHKFYVYDAYELPEEKLSYDLRHEENLIYKDWNAFTPYGIDKTQVRSYQDAIDRYKEECEWQIAVDIDEYPLATNDTEPGFLVRSIKKIADSNVAEISIQNYMLIGPANFDERFWLGERYFRLTKEPGNNLVKPIYRPKMVKAQVHHNQIIQMNAHSMDAPDNQLKMIHIWGARLTDFKEGEQLSQKLLDKTYDYIKFRDLINKIKNWLL